MLGTYEGFCKWRTPEGGTKADLGPSTHLIGGALAGVMYWTAFFPADTVKSLVSRKQIQYDYFSLAIFVHVSHTYPRLCPRNFFSVTMMKNKKDSNAPRSRRERHCRNISNFTSKRGIEGVVSRLDHHSYACCSCPCTHLCYL
jgi:hypothetical protein